jgi:hypothetical protein
MTFVYEGKGRNGGKTENGAPPECAKKACAIQWCLAKRNHQLSFCQAYIDDWKACQQKYMAIHHQETNEIKKES